jgi:hypothetical protein
MELNKKVSLPGLGSPEDKNEAETRSEKTIEKYPELVNDSNL